MTEPRRAANVCQCGHMFGRLVEVHCSDGLWQLIEMNGMRFFEMTAICPACGRWFWWVRQKARRKE